MKMRLLTFWRAAGPVQAVLFGAAAVFFLVVCGSLAVRGRFAEPLMAVPVCFFAAWVLRDLLIRFARPMLRVMQAAWLVMMVSVFFRPTSGWFPGDEWVIFPVLGLYLGGYFWMMSDLRVHLALMLR